MIFSTNYDYYLLLFLQKLSSNIIVTHEGLPKGISVTFTSNCEGGEKPSYKGICNNVAIGNEVT